MHKLLLTLLLALAPTAFASVWYVDGVNGNDQNNCKTRQTACKTIGHAISLASPGDTIGVGPATYTENLTINFSLKIVGSSASTTIIDGGGVGTVVTIPYNPNGNVTLSSLTIRNGFGPYGGGIYTGAGGLTIIRCVIEKNSSEGLGAGILAAGDGDFGLTISESIISGSSGTGIYNEEVMEIYSSTISGNTGAGIYNANPANLYLTNSTISGNSGGGILNGKRVCFRTCKTIGAMTLADSIVANSTSGGNCSGPGSVTSEGYNLSSDGTCNFNGPGDLNNTDPKLGNLGNYGGPTQTIPLLKGSPAIDAGNPSVCIDANGNPETTDQRGAPRPDKEDSVGCDMGAFERQSD